MFSAGAGVEPAVGRVLRARPWRWPSSRARPGSPTCTPAPVLVVDAYWQDLGEAMIDQVWPWHRLMTISTAEAYRGQVAAAWAVAPTTRRGSEGDAGAPAGPRRALAWFQRQWSALDGPIARELRFLAAPTTTRSPGRTGAARRTSTSTRSAASSAASTTSRRSWTSRFGNDQADNRKATRQQLVDCASSSRFASPAHRRTPILSRRQRAGVAAISDRLGCRWLWPAV